MLFSLRSSDSTLLKQSAIGGRGSKHPLMLKMIRAHMTKDDRQIHRRNVHTLFLGKLLGELFNELEFNELELLRWEM